MEYVTLARDDADFDAYLMGTFSDTERALPIDTYDVRTPRERVTFRVVALNKLKIPHWWIIYFTAMRPELVALTLGPAVTTWLAHRAPPPAWERPMAWAAMLGVFFLHVAAFLWNDVHDHIDGSDRLNRRRGSRVIQKGWATAASMKTWAKINAALAVACGLPALAIAPLELLGVCLASGAALAVLSRNWGTRWGACDLALIALFGPLLSCGVAIASFGEAGIVDVIVGLAFGFSTLWVLQVRQFENLFRAKPESFRTFLGHLNFDGARWTSVIEGLMLLAFLPTAAVVVRVPLIFIVVLPLFGIPLVTLANRIFRASSPLSSDLVGASRRALISHFTFTVWWLLAVGTAWL